MSVVWFPWFLVCAFVCFCGCVGVHVCMHVCVMIMSDCCCLASWSSIQCVPRLFAVDITAQHDQTDRLPSGMSQCVSVIDVFQRGLGIVKPRIVVAPLTSFESGEVAETIRRCISQVSLRQANTSHEAGQ